MGVFGILNLNLREFGRGFEIVEIGWMGFEERDRTVVVRFWRSREGSGHFCVSFLFIFIQI